VSLRPRARLTDAFGVPRTVLPLTRFILIYPPGLRAGGYQMDYETKPFTKPAGRLMFQITGAFAEFERSMIRQRVRAGLKRAVEKGSILGRPKIGAELERRIQAQLRAGKGILATAKELGVGTGTVHRIARAMRPFESAAA
jgi:hypothetical protein